ncbi:MAG: hypothetical protein WAM03_19260, partial [Pseudolabrys sp.]
MQKVPDFSGADGGTRTLTGNLPRDFKSFLSQLRKYRRGAGESALLRKNPWAIGIFTDIAGHARTLPVQGLPKFLR